MKVSADIERIVDTALAGEQPGRDERVRLMGVDEFSLDAHYINLAADKRRRELSDNTAEVHAQIGIDANPCSKNCQFCSFAARIRPTSPDRFRFIIRFSNIFTVFPPFCDGSGTTASAADPDSSCVVCACVFVVSMPPVADCVALTVPADSDGNARLHPTNSAVISRQIDTIPHKIRFLFFMPPSIPASYCRMTRRAPPVQNDDTSDCKQTQQNTGSSKR